MDTNNTLTVSGLVSIVIHVVPEDPLGLNGLGVP